MTRPISLPMPGSPSQIGGPGVPNMEGSHYPWFSQFESSYTNGPSVQPAIVHRVDVARPVIIRGIVAEAYTFVTPGADPYTVIQPSVGHVNLQVSEKNIAEGWRHAAVATVSGLVQSSAEWWFADTLRVAPVSWRLPACSLSVIIGNVLGGAITVGYTCRVSLYGDQV